MAAPRWPRSSSISLVFLATRKPDCERHDRSRTTWRMERSNSRSTSLSFVPSGFATGAETHSVLVSLCMRFCLVARARWSGIESWPNGNSNSLGVGLIRSGAAPHSIEATSRRSPRATVPPLHPSLSPSKSLPIRPRLGLDLDKRLRMRPPIDVHVIRSFVPVCEIFTRRPRHPFGALIISSSV